jgi:hypothetical protein
MKLELIATACVGFIFGGFMGVAIALLGYCILVGLLLAVS